MNNNDLFKDLQTTIRDIQASIASIDRTLIKQQGNLELHMARTDANEKLIERLNEDLKPIKKHVAQLEGALKFIGIVALLLSVAATAMKVFGWI